MTLPISKPQVGGTGWHTNYWQMVDLWNSIDERIRDLIGATVVAGVGLEMVVNDAGDTVTLNNTSLSDTEAIQDMISTFLVEGTGITLTYDDTGNTLTIDASAAGGLDAEGVRDTMATALVGTAPIVVTPNDGSDTITISTTLTQYDDSSARGASQRIVALTDGATITPNSGTTDVGTVTIAGNRTIANPSGTPTGARKLILRIKQDGTGSRTVTWGSAYRFSGGTPPTLTTAANKTDYIGFIYNVVDAVWDCVAFKGNF